MRNNLIIYGWYAYLKYILVMVDKQEHLNQLKVYATLGASNHSNKERDLFDYYATPPSAVEELLKRETFSENIIEPSCGELNISKVLEAHGHQVKNFDILDRLKDGSIIEQDFLLENHYYPQSDIITNPPYEKATEFVYHSLNSIDEGQKVAMLLKLTFLETKKRKALFLKYPAKKIYVFSYRIECLKNNIQQNKVGSSAVCYAWYIWEKGYQGPMTIEII